MFASTIGVRSSRSKYLTKLPFWRRYHDRCIKSIKKFLINQKLMLIKFRFFIHGKKSDFHIISLNWYVWPQTRFCPNFRTSFFPIGLVPEENVPNYARWVSGFLAFCNKSSYLDHDTLTSEFMHFLKSEKNIADWQVRQPEEALGLYLYHVKRVFQRSHQIQHLLFEIFFDRDSQCLCHFFLKVISIEQTFILLIGDIGHLHQHRGDIRSP